MTDDGNLGDSSNLVNKNKLLINQLQFMNDELVKMTKKYENEKKMHESDLEASRSDLTHMIEESVDLKNQIQSLHEDLDDTENQLVNVIKSQSLVNENRLLRKDIRTLKNQIESIASQYEMVRDEYNSAIYESNDLRQQLLTQKNELLIKSNELKRIWSELEQNRSDMAMMMREYAEIHDGNDAPTNWKEMQDDNSKKSTEIESLQRYNNTVTSLLNEMRLELMRISQQQSCLPCMDDDITGGGGDETISDTETLNSHGLVRQLLCPQDIQIALTLSIRSLAEMMEEFTQSNDVDLIHRVSLLLLVKKQLILVNDETKMVIRRDDMYRDTMVKQDMKIEDLEKDIDVLKRTNTNLMAQTTSNVYEMHALQQKVRERERELDMIRNDMTTMSAANPSVKSTVMSSTAVKKDDDCTVATMRESFSKKLQEDSETKSGLMREKEVLLEASEKKQREIQSLQKSIDALNEKITCQTQLLVTKDSAIDSLKEHLKELETSMTTMKQERDKITSDYSLSISELKRIVASHEKTIQEKESQIDDLQDSIDDEKSITDKLRKDLNDISTARNRLRLDVKELEEDNDELLDELRNITANMKKYKETEKKLIEVTEEKEDLEDRVDELEKKIEKLKQSKEEVPKHAIFELNAINGEKVICYNVFDML